jgi:hypothetical protein
VQNLHHQVYYSRVAPIWLRYGKVLLHIGYSQPVVDARYKRQLAVLRLSPFNHWLLTCSLLTHCASLACFCSLDCRFIFNLYLLGTNVSYHPLQSLFCKVPLRLCMFACVCNTRDTFRIRSLKKTLWQLHYCTSCLLHNHLRKHPQNSFPSHHGHYS